MRLILTCIIGETLLSSCISQVMCNVFSGHRAARSAQEKQLHAAVESRSSEETSSVQRGQSTPVTKRSRFILHAIPRGTGERGAEWEPGLFLGKPLMFLLNVIYATEPADHTEKKNPLRIIITLS